MWLCMNEGHLWMRPRGRSGRIAHDRPPLRVCWSRYIWQDDLFRAAKVALPFTRWHELPGMRIAIDWLLSCGHHVFYCRWAALRPAVENWVVITDLASIAEWTKHAPAFDNTGIAGLVLAVRGPVAQPACPSHSRHTQRPSGAGHHVREQPECAGDQGLELVMQGEGHVNMRAATDLRFQQSAAKRWHVRISDLKQRAIGAVPLWGEIQAAFSDPSVPVARADTVRGVHQARVGHQNADRRGRIGDAPSIRGRADGNASGRGLVRFGSHASVGRW